ncbi:MAG: hypothetical protein J0L80_10620 [Chitinophagales bacterium]|nr:hypothetical protein [Chitinophagales bacterium]
MNTEEIIEELSSTKNLTIRTIEEIEENSTLRHEMIQYFEKNKNREFALAFLNILAELRKNFRWDIPEDICISGDSLMLGCYILGMHGRIEDCIEIWKVKTIDFDTYCYIDIQLVPFLGIEETMEYLKKDTSEYASDALKYITECLEAGDFNNLELYYKQTPWFV